MSERDDLKKILDEAASKLGEHFDSVRILATKHSGEGATTISVDSGLGNFYAQLGQVCEWLDIQRQFQRNWAIRKDSEDQ